MPGPLTIYPIQAPVRERPFDLFEAILDGVAQAGLGWQAGDVIAVSSKYAAIAAGRVYDLDDIKPTPRARELAERYNMSAAIAQLVLDEADHVFGGIRQGFLLTARSGIISPNAGLDRSNIPSGQVVLLPENPFKSAQAIFEALHQRLGRHVAVIMTDSWLLPGRYGTGGIALGAAGFKPIQDERGKVDLFGNPMAVTQVGVADALAACAQVVMGERDQATPFALLRGADIELTCDRFSADDISIPWRQCIYVESLTSGLLPDGAPERRRVEISDDSGA